MPNNQTNYDSLTDIAKVHTALIKLLIPVTLDAVYKEVVNQALRVGGAQYGTILLYDENKKSFKRPYSNVPPSQQFNPRPKGNTFWVYQHKKPKFIPRSELLSNHPYIDPNVHSVILIPLSSQEKRLGVLSLQSTISTPFKNKHHEALLLFGTIASLAIRKAQLHEQKQKALETRDLFISAASHELKTPLSTIRAYAELIEQKVSEGKPIVSKTVDAIIRNVDKLAEMINSLFMASQVSAGTFNSHRENFDLFQVTKQCLEDIKTSSKREINFKSNSSQINYFGDKSQWYTVVTNLLRNAISYSPKNSPVFVTLNSTQDSVTLEVTNNGKGINKNDLKHIFEKYFRSKQQKAGLGLGLFLCHQIIKAHKGTIKIVSQPNIKTVVSVNLPKYDQQT